MKIPINLASQPFRRVRAMLLASVAVSLLLVGTLAAVVSLILAERAQMADVRHDVNRLNGRIREAGAEQAKLAAVLNKPENAEVLERSVFINTLLYRKGISWTRIFSDLEKTLPYNVKVLQIRPTLDDRNQVLLDMTLASESAAAAIQAEMALEKSPLFGEVFSPTSTPPTQADPLYKFRVTVNYASQL
jgi:type IV pilus assembly protein PilN